MTKYLDLCKIKNDLADIKQDVKNHGMMIGEIYDKLRQDREDWDMVRKQVFVEPVVGCGAECVDVEFYKIAKRNIELPRDGEEYWYVEADGQIESEIYDVNGLGEEIDWERWKFGNYFRSKNEAEEARQKIKEALGGA